MTADVLMLAMTDGRAECFARMLESAERMLPDGDNWWPIARRVIHDDSGDPAYRAWLEREAPGFEIVSTPERAGFAGAIRNAWRYLNATADQDTCSYIFATEDDFVFERKVDLGAMAGVLHRHPELAQLVLRRQPWSAAEREAGGVIEQHPEWYTDRVEHGDAWVEHSAYFSTNPYLARRPITWEDWPDAEGSEGRFTISMREKYPGIRFGFWGERTDAPWVEHIGVERVGGGY